MEQNQAHTMLLIRQRLRPDLLKLLRRRVEARVSLFLGRVSYKDAFLRLRVELLSFFVRDVYIHNASEHFEVRKDRRRSNKDLIWS